MIPVFAMCGRFPTNKQCCGGACADGGVGCRNCAGIRLLDVSYPDGMVGILSFLQVIALEIHTRAQNMQPFLLK